MLVSSPRFFLSPFTTSSFSARLIRGNHKVRGIAGPPTLTLSLSRKADYSSSVAEMETVNTGARLSALRKLMKERKLDVYGEPSPCQNQELTSHR